MIPQTMQNCHCDDSIKFTANLYLGEEVGGGGELL